jgi:hypothetical protein
MNLRTLVPSILTAVALAACSGVGSNNASLQPAVTPTSAPLQSAAVATGTMTIVVPPPNGATSNTRRPSWISSATQHVGLFVDGGNTFAGSSTTCRVAGCSFAWTSTAGTHSFVVEIDDGVQLLGAGVRSYSLNAGANGLLSPLTINGIATTITFTTTTCGSNNCGGTISVGDFDGQPILNAGGSTSFDNAPLSFCTTSTTTCTSTSIGSITPTSLAGPTSSGTYSFAVACNSGATGNFQIVPSSGGSATLTTAEESANFLFYFGFSGNGTGQFYTCNNGVISYGSATGTIPIQ